MKIPLAVVGAHLRGQPLNYQLLELGAEFGSGLSAVCSGEYVTSQAGDDSL